MAADTNFHFRIRRSSGSDLSAYDAYSGRVPAAVDADAQYFYGFVHSRFVLCVFTIQNLISFCIVGGCRFEIYDFIEESQSFFLIEDLSRIHLQMIICLLFTPIFLMFDLVKLTALQAKERFFIATWLLSEGLFLQNIKI